MNKLSSVFISFILIITVMSPAIARETKRRDSKTRTAAKIGVGTALGAGIGALIGGGRGAAAGALIGGGAMTHNHLLNVIPVMGVKPVWLAQLLLVVL